MSSFSMLVAIAAGLSLPAAQAPATFCERLAPKIGMKPTSKPDMWEVRTLSALKTALIGGSTTVMMGVGSAGPATPEEYDRLSKACRPGAKGPECDLVGPIELQLTIKDRETVKEIAREGERALVAMVGSRVRCTNLRA